MKKNRQRMTDYVIYLLQRLQTGIARMGVKKMRVIGEGTSN
jgi:hypothetical protein